MKLNNGLLSLLFTSATLLSYSQKISLPENWTGILQQGYGTQFQMEMAVKQDGSNISGTAKYTYTDMGQQGFVIFGISGSINVNQNTIELTDESVIDEAGSINSWCKKRYAGTFKVQNGTVSNITGTWQNDGSRIFTNKMLQMGGSCSPGTFSVTVAKQGALNKPVPSGQTTSASAAGGIDGEWSGTLEETNMFAYFIKVNMAQANGSITGTLEAEKTDMYIKLSIKGKVEGQDVVFHTDSVMEERGTNSFKRLDFRGSPFAITGYSNIASALEPALRNRLDLSDGAPALKGYAANTQSSAGGWLYFQGKTLQSNRYGSVPVSFILAKTDTGKQALALAKTCISGNCVDGYGVRVTAEGRYEGYFKQGQKEGRGTWDYYTGLYKGNRYIGEFSHDAFNGQGVLYDVIPKEKISTGPAYRPAFYITDATGARLVKIYEGGWLQNYPRGLGKYYQATALPQVAMWVGWYKDNFNTPPLDVILRHLDTTFARFEKCDCLTPGQVTMHASRMKNIAYDIIDEHGRVVDTKNELIPEDYTYQVQGFVNKTDHVIFIKGYRKYLNPDSGKQAYEDESYAVMPGQEIFGNYRAIPAAGVSITLWEKGGPGFVYLGQYKFK